MLENAKLEVDLPVLGGRHLRRRSFFDIGVYLVVVGLVLYVLEAFGDDDPDATASPSTSVTRRTWPPGVRGRPEVAS